MYMYTVYFCLCLLIFTPVTWVSIACLTFASFGGNNWIKFRWWHEPGRSERLCGSLYASLFCISFGAPDLHICDSGAMGELMETIFQIDQLPKIVGFYARLRAFSGGWLSDLVEEPSSELWDMDADQRLASTNINKHLHKHTCRLRLYVFFVPFSSMFANKDKWKDLTKWDPQVKCPPNGVWKPSRSRSLRQRISRRLESWMKGRHLEILLKQQA